MTDLLEIASHGRCLRVCLNRPDKRNALSAELCRELARVLDDAGRDSRYSVILLEAKGKAFCAGMDVSEMGSLPTAEIDQAHEQLFTVGARLRKPLVGAAQGAALGGGLGLAANCHILIASEDASFGLTEIRLGLWPFLVYRAVSAALGERRTLELALTGRVFSAAEALRLGLVHEVAADVGRRALEVAESLASWSPIAVSKGMEFVQETRGADWEAAGRIGRRIRGEVFGSADFTEGIAAFREKRAPKWPSSGGLPPDIGGKSG